MYHNSLKISLVFYIVLSSVGVVQGALIEEKYRSYLTVGGTRYFHHKSSFASTYNLWMPLLETEKGNLLFTDLRIFDRNGSSFEGNVHFGFRRLLENREWIWGLYGAYDKRKSDYGNWFQQITLGGEAWLGKWFIGGNFYLPVGCKEQLVNWDYCERANYGYDLELGYHWFEGFSTHLGLYQFKARQTTAILGGQMRVMYSYIPQRSWLGFIEECKTELGLRHDREHVTGYVGLSFRFGLGGNTLRGEGFKRHMTSLINRDPDIKMTENTNFEPLKGVEKGTEELLSEVGLTFDGHSLEELCYLNNKVYLKRAQLVHPDRYLNAPEEVKEERKVEFIKISEQHELIRQRLLNEIIKRDQLLKDKVVDEQDNSGKKEKMKAINGNFGYSKKDFLLPSENSVKQDKDIKNCYVYDQSCLNTKISSIIEKYKEHFPSNLVYAWENNPSNFVKFMHDGLCQGYVLADICLQLNGNNRFPEYLKILRDYDCRISNSVITEDLITFISQVTFFQNPPTFWARGLDVNSDNFFAKACKYFYPESRAGLQKRYLFDDFAQLKKHFEMSVYSPVKENHYELGVYGRKGGHALGIHLNNSKFTYYNADKGTGVEENLSLIELMDKIKGNYSKIVDGRQVYPIYLLSEYANTKETKEIEKLDASDILVEYSPEPLIKPLSRIEDSMIPVCPRDPFLPLKVAVDHGLANDCKKYLSAAIKYCYSKDPAAESCCLLPFNQFLLKTATVGNCDVMGILFKALDYFDVHELKLNFSEFLLNAANFGNVEAYLNLLEWAGIFAEKNGLRLIPFIESTYSGNKEQLDLLFLNRVSFEMVNTLVSSLLKEKTPLKGYKQLLARVLTDNEQVFLAEFMKFNSVLEPLLKNLKLKLVGADKELKNRNLNMPNVGEL